MTEVFGARLEPVVRPETYFTWLSGGPSLPDVGFEPAWALALCTDGVTWGYFKSGGWVMGSNYFTRLCPPVTTDNLLELRLFGEKGELLLWREDPGFGARVLVDYDGLEPDYPPLVEKPFLLGKPTGEYRDLFSRTKDHKGCEQAVPIPVEKDIRCRVLVKHYMVQNTATGVLQIAVSRLAGLEVDK